jgi:hypothetical protein
LYRSCAIGCQHYSYFIWIDGSAPEKCCSRACWDEGTVIAENITPPADG